MTFSMPLRLGTAVAALVTITACKPGTSVGSPSPATSPTAAASAAAAPALPAGVTLAMIAEGKTLFEAQTSNCSRCHGPDGKGNQRGPDLTDAEWVQIDGSYPAIVTTITTGVPAANFKGTFPNSMRPKGGSQLTEAQINSVAAYVYSLSHK